MDIRLLARLALAAAICLAWPSVADAQFTKATPEQIARDIKDLKAGGNGRTFALRRLDKYEGPLPDKQAEVAELLLKLVREDKSYDAMRALAVWATEAELREIKVYLGSGAISKAAVYVYSKKKHLPVAKQLAGFLEGGGGERKDVIEALILLCPEAEGEVIPYLSSKRKETVRHATEILGRAGTNKSLEELNKVVNQYEKKDTNITTTARSAITKIEEREKTARDR